MTPSALFSFLFAELAITAGMRAPFEAPGANPKQRLHHVNGNPCAKRRKRCHSASIGLEEKTMAETPYDQQPTLGIPGETAGPLIALVVVGISALVVVLVLLARDRQAA